MASLLYIRTSPRTERSFSIAVTDAIVDVYQQQNPDDTINTLDLFHADLPEFNELTVNAKYKILHGKAHNIEEKKAWESIEYVIDSFVSADKYVFAVPMWNFGLPYKTKRLGPQPKNRPSQSKVSGRRCRSVVWLSA